MTEPEPVVIEYEFTHTEMKCVADAWAAWLRIMTLTYGEPPAGALPNLRQTFYVGVLSALKLTQEGVLHADLANECMYTGMLEQIPKEAMGSAQ